MIQLLDGCGVMKFVEGVQLMSERERVIGFKIVESRSNGSSTSRLAMRTTRVCGLRRDHPSRLMRQIVSHGIEQFSYV